MPLLLTLAGMLIAAQAPGPSALGPGIGERLPAFEAVDQHGRPQSFETLVGPNGLVLVFFRSADW